MSKTRIDPWVVVYAVAMLTNVVACAWLPWVTIVVGTLGFGAALYSLAGRAPWARSLPRDLVLIGSSVGWIFLGLAWILISAPSDPRPVAQRVALPTAPPVERQPSTPVLAPHTAALAVERERIEGRDLDDAIDRASAATSVGADVIRDYYESEVPGLAARLDLIRELGYSNLAEAFARCDAYEFATATERTDLAVEAVVDGSRRARLVVRSNLPIRTKIMASVYGRAFRGDSRLEISERCSISAAFGPPDGLPKGMYRAEARTVAATAQSDGVRNALGDDFDALRGPLVRRGQLGRYVEADTDFPAGGDRAQAATADANRDAEWDRLEAEYRDVIWRGGPRMARLRRDESARGLRECGIEMRRLQGRLDSLGEAATRAHADMLNRMLGPAKLCVSCSAAAPSHCETAREMFGDWKSVRRNMAERSR